MTAKWIEASDPRLNAKLIRHLIEAMFDSQSEAARQLGVADRTVRYWLERGAAGHVMTALNRLRAKEITLKHARRLLHTTRQRRSFKRKRAA